MLYKEEYHNTCVCGAEAWPITDNQGQHQSWYHGIQYTFTTIEDHDCKGIFEKVDPNDDSETLPVGAYIEDIMSTLHNSSAGLSERINNQSCGGLQWMNQG